MSKKIKSFEPKDREELQNYRMDKAIEKVEKLLREDRGLFSIRLKDILDDGYRGRRMHVAKDAGVSPSTITQWECKTPPSFTKLADLCRTIDVDANYLLGLSSEYKTQKEIEENSGECPHCGTTELLCGHNGVGCTSAKANQ